MPSFSPTLFILSSPRHVAGRSGHRRENDRRGRVGYFMADGDAVKRFSEKAFSMT